MHRGRDEGSEPVSMKRKSNAPNCGAWGPTAIPIKIRKGMLDKPSLLARAMANAISPSAKPISKTMLSTSSHPALPSTSSRFRALMVRLSPAAISVAPSFRTVSASGFVRFV